MNKCPRCASPVLACAEYCLYCIPAEGVCAFRVLSGQVSWFPIKANEASPAGATFAIVDPKDRVQLEVTSVGTQRSADGAVVLAVEGRDVNGGNRSLEVLLGELVCRYGRERDRTEVLP